MRLTAQQKIEIAEAIERIAFSPAQPEPEREEVCRNCGAKVEYSFDHWELDQPPGGPPLYFCKPAPSPAPVAGELPEAVSNAARIMRFVASTPAVSDNDTEALLCRADALESWARSQATAQPVAVGMTPELERLLKNAEYAEVAMRTGFNPPYLLMDAELRHSIAAVRAQAASAQPGRDLPKVRAILYRLWAATGPEISDDQITAAIAELDAQPKAVGVPVEAIRNTVRRVLFSANDSAQVTIDAEEIDRWLAVVEGWK